MPISNPSNKLPQFLAAIIFTVVLLVVGNYLIFDYGNRRIESVSTQIIEVHERSIRGLDMILLQLQNIRLDVLLLSMQADDPDRERFTSGEEHKGVIESINASTYLMRDQIATLSKLGKDQDEALITELYRELIDSLPGFLQHRVILGTEFAGIDLTGFGQFQRKVSQLNALHQQREEQLSIQLTANSNQFKLYLLFFVVVSLSISAAIIAKMTMVIQKSFSEQFRIQQQHLALLEGTPGGILECDLSGAVLYSNSACSRITGHTSDQINNRPIQDFIPELQGSQALASRLQSLATKLGEENSCETKVINLQDQEVNIQLDWRFDREESSQPKKIFFTVTDITRRVHAEREQNRLLTALDASINEIYMFNADNMDFTYVSPGARANLGFDMASLEHMTPVSIKPEHTLETFAELASPLLRKEKSQLVFETVHQRADGSCYPVEVRMQLVHDLEPPQYLAIISDITARKLVEIELKESLAEVSALKEQLQEENVYLREEIQLTHPHGQIIGECPQIKRVLSAIEKVARTEVSVLILGETGTGKELIARAIHEMSPRSGSTMISVNCAALSESLIESELFGHERGAFTGAQKLRKGRFELADKGTLFLDEIAEMPLELQAKLLRVLQAGTFERLGGTKTLHVDVRLIAATNRDLQKFVDEGGFRADLFYRINSFPIQLPPLRDRGDDVLLLTEHFIHKYAGQVGREITSISPRMLRHLRERSWPGNARELESFIEYTLISGSGTVLDYDEPLAELTRGAEPAELDTSLHAAERKHIRLVLEKAGGKIAGRHGAATLLGIPPSTLRSKMKRLGITPAV